MKFNLMTWNVSLYQEAGNVKKADCPRYQSIVNIVKGQLEKKNSLVVLQEVPYMYKDDTDEKWKKHSIYEEFLKDFPEDEYTMVKDTSNQYQIMMTVMIWKKNNEYFNNINSHDFSNNSRIVGCECKSENIIFFGVHMPTDFEIEEGDDKKTIALKKWKESVWDGLIQYIENNKERKLVIIGDFNAFIGCKHKKTEEKFITISRSIKSIIAQNETTYKRKTGIDNIFVNFGSGYKTIIERNCEFSDHKYILCEYNDALEQQKFKEQGIC